ncbi:DNA polymerase alpha/epsilon subunit B-domain-containing protein [Obelidium mucronatum]|nr:DNA polymerase alpha/epsilon subunit B-domain-containing protein [Obelidium mucronatum]
MLRAPASFVDHSAPWRPVAAASVSYATQYAGLYFSRLALQRPKAFKAAGAKWADSDVIQRVLDVPRTNSLVVIAGTVFVDMPLKPCILDVVAKESWVAAPPPRSKYTSDKDRVMLEDESGRLELVGAPIDSAFLVSGVIVAVLGFENGNNQFQVQDICYPEYNIEHPMSTIEEDMHVAFVSGISIGVDFALSLELQLLIDYITGESGVSSDQQRTSSIVRLVIAGNSMAKKNVIESSYAAGSMAKSGSEIYTPSSLTALDNLLAQFCSNIETDLMPGDQDPTNYAIPQNPMLSGLFPTARGFSSLHCVTNPYSASIEGVRLLGNSGQPLNDIYKFVDGEDRLAMAERTLQWASMAPTAPDTLACYPFQDRDPFIIETHPDVYFIGNQPEFGTRLVTGARGEKTRIVLIPSFLETKTIALVNLRTLECRKVSFK